MVWIAYAIRMIRGRVAIVPFIQVISYADFLASKRYEQCLEKTRVRKSRGFRTVRKSI